MQREKPPRVRIPGKIINISRGGSHAAPVISRTTLSAVRISCEPAQQLVKNHGQASTIADIVQGRLAVSQGTGNDRPDGPVTKQWMGCRGPSKIPMGKICAFQGPANISAARGLGHAKRRAGKPDHVFMQNPTHQLPRGYFRATVWIAKRTEPLEKLPPTAVISNGVSDQ